MLEEKRPRKTTKVISLDELMKKENEKLAQAMKPTQHRSGMDKANVPKNYELRVRDEKSSVSSITLIPEIRNMKIDDNALNEINIERYENNKLGNKNDIAAAEALPFILQQGANYDTAVLTVASMIEGDSQQNSKLYTDSNKENKASAARNRNRDHALNWAMISVRAANIVVGSGGNDKAAEAVASAILMAGRENASKRKDLKSFVNRVASKASHAALVNGCNKAVARAISKEILKNGEQILSTDFKKRNMDFTNIDFDNLSHSDQKTMIISVMKDADNQIQKITDNMNCIKESRKDKREKLKTDESNAMKEKKKLKKKLAQLDDECTRLDNSLYESHIGSMNSSYERKQLKKIEAVDENREKLRNRMKYVSSSMKKKKKQALRTDRKLKVKENTLRQKLEKIRRERRRMDKMLHQIKGRIKERRKKENEIKTETKEIMTEKARLAEMLQMLKAEVKRNKSKIKNSEKFAAISAMNTKIRKGEKSLNKKNQERQEYIDELTRKMEAVEMERAALYKRKEHISDFIQEKELEIQNAGFDRAMAEAELMEQIAAVEAEKATYLDLVQQAKRDENDRHRFEQMLYKEQAAAKKDKQRLQERIKRIQQTEAIFRKKEEALRNRIAAANIEIMSEWKMHQMAEKELKEGKKVNFKDDFSEIDFGGNNYDASLDESDSSDFEERSEDSMSTFEEVNADDYSSIDSSNIEDDTNSIISSNEQSRPKTEDKSRFDDNKEKKLINSVPDNMHSFEDDDVTFEEYSNDEASDLNQTKSEISTQDDGEEGIEVIYSDNDMFSKGSHLSKSDSVRESFGISYTHSNNSTTENSIKSSLHNSLGQSTRKSIAESIHQILKQNTQESGQNSKQQNAQKSITLSQSRSFQNGFLGTVSEESDESEPDNDEPDDEIEILNKVSMHDNDWFQNTNIWNEENRERLEQTMAELKKNTQSETKAPTTFTKKKQARGGFKFGNFRLRRKQAVKDSKENFRKREMTARRQMKREISSQSIVNYTSPSQIMPSIAVKKKKGTMTFFGRRKKSNM